MRAQPRFHVAFKKAWNRLATPDVLDDLCVLELEAWTIWKSAQRYERNRLKKAGRLKP